MNNVTPEHLVTVTQGASPAQIATMVFLGVIAFALVLIVGKWVIDLKMGTLPQDLKDIQKSLDALKDNMRRLEGKLWDKEDIQREFRAAIADHIEKCPYHHQKDPN